MGIEEVDGKYNFDRNLHLLPPHSKLSSYSIVACTYYSLSLEVCRRIADK